MVDLVDWARRGEGSENATLGGKRCLFSDPSPLDAGIMPGMERITEIPSI